VIDQTLTHLRARALVHWCSRDRGPTPMFIQPILIELSIPIHLSE
jgi:hypothetical protein